MGDHEQRSRRIAIEASTLWRAAAIAAAFLVSGALLLQAADVFVLLFAGVVIAEGARPLARPLVRLGLPKGLAAFAVYALIATVAGLTAWALLVPLIAQAATFIDALPAYTASAQLLLLRAQEVLRNNPGAVRILTGLQAQAAALAGSLAGRILYSPISALGLISDIVLVGFIGIYWVAAADELHASFLRVLPAGRRRLASKILAEMGTKAGAYVRGVLVGMVAIGLLSGFGVAALGVPYALLLGVVAGLTEVVPILGPLLGGSVSAAVALVTKGPLCAFEVVVLYTVIQQVEGNLLVPFVMQRAVKLNPLTIIVTFLIGGKLLGIAGVLLAVPAVALLQVIVENLLAEREAAAATARAKLELPADGAPPGMPPPEILPAAKS
jgi:predicted PurR-regulated permease PerM